MNAREYAEMVAASVDGAVVEWRGMPVVTSIGWGPYRSNLRTNPVVYRATAVCDEGDYARGEGATAQEAWKALDSAIRVVEYCEANQEQIMRDVVAPMVREMFVR